MKQLVEAIEAALPDNVIVQDVRRILAQEPYHYQIKIGRRRLAIPQDVKIDVIKRAVFKEYYDVYYGDAFKVQVAVGGVTDRGHGIRRAGYCFGTLWYDRGRALVAVQFHLSMYEK